VKAEAIALKGSSEWTGLVRLALLMGAALLITNMGMPQWVTGPLINGLLILSVEWGGVSQGIAVGMVTPIGAALRGILPLPLFAMIPFIVLGNAFMVSLYGALRHRGRGLSLVVAAIGKFALLYGAVSLLLVRPLYLEIGGRSHTVTLSSAVLAMMGWPQLLTALAGGALAFGVLEAGRRRGNSPVNPR
jgi:hypothetical protein